MNSPKKISKVELPKVYEPKLVESKWYTFWESKSFFTADPESKADPYCIVIPPPNVTGKLHMGHALVNILQDILCRWQRMKGKAVLWLPGTDHAGIATQTVVERHLMKTEGKRRTDYKREAFLAHVWKWKERHEDNILSQLKSLACSCDWSRQRFTMDDGCNKAVRSLFKKMYDDGLIYRGDYLVNWDPLTQTALADDEVEYEDRDSYLWFFKYPLKGEDRHLTIATTRPETMLGDTAVAVNPKDERYKDYIGKTIILPLNHREIPIISDPFVDPEFGTGAVKITPAHDPNDYQMGLKHKLPFINIMTPDGHINENGGKFQGLTMEKAREAIVSMMKNQGFLDSIQAHAHRVGISYRSKAIIEPFLSKQWFVNMQPFRKKLRTAVESKKTTITPNNWENTYYHWIDNLRDWCISRQLWWGHRIPIWYKLDDPEQMICYDGEGVPPEVAKNPDNWVQEMDVLDTWFSSALWPLSTLGWPEKTPELTKFFPNSVLVTGHDILFFWVARMIMVGEYLTGEVPFPEVFLHGLIYGKSYWRDHPSTGIAYVSAEEQSAFDLGKVPPKDVKSKWEKMSKSKGNIIDPLEIIDDYGTDAMRIALCASASHARQIDLDRRRFEDYRNFTNKVWNGARFVFMNLEANEKSGTGALTAKAFSQGLKEELLTLEDRWILSAMNQINKTVNEKLESYAFDQAASLAYDFFWKEFCAYYVEINKPFLFEKEGSPAQRENKQKLLVIILCNTLRLLHPMTPFITEEIFQQLKNRLEGLTLHEDVDVYTRNTVHALNTESCMLAEYPKVLKESDIDKNINHTFSLMEELIYTIRNIRGEMKLPSSTKTDIYISGPDGDENLEIVRKNLNIISALIKTNSLKVTGDEPSLALSSIGLVGQLRVTIPLPESLKEKEKARLKKESERLSLQFEKTQKQLSNKNFVKKAPKLLIEKQRNLLKQTEDELKQVQTKLTSFEINT